MHAQVVEHEESLLPAVAHKLLHRADQDKRVCMFTDSLDDASAAFGIGYESPNQFSRAYGPFCSQPSMRDIRARRLAGAATSCDSLDA